MPKYKVLEKSYINNRIAEEGEIVEYEGQVSENLELVAEESVEKKPPKAKAGGDSPLV